LNSGYFKKKSFWSYFDLEEFMNLVNGMALKKVNFPESNAIVQTRSGHYFVWGD